MGARDPSPLAPHSASPSDLRERLEAERRGMPFLVLRDGDGRQLLVTLDGPDRLILGRSSESDVALGWDAEVSRAHAELERVGGEWTVVDDGLSSNGTYLNGARVAARERLRDGDLLRLGRTVIAFRRPGSGESSATVVAGDRAARKSASRARSGTITFSATRRSRESCVARKTTPMPPRPATPSIR